MSESYLDQLVEVRDTSGNMVRGVVLEERGRDHLRENGWDLLIDAAHQGGHRYARTDEPSLRIVPQEKPLDQVDEGPGESGESGEGGAAVAGDVGEEGVRGRA